MGVGGPCVLLKKDLSVLLASSFLKDTYQMGRDQHCPVCGPQTLHLRNSLACLLYTQIPNLTSDSLWDGSSDLNI